MAGREKPEEGDGGYGGLGLRKKKGKGSR
ncbi:uncharacterized protein G2W53_044944 [Senna tora]|uniref:Uncharacterized protein n=1 Tax=Senna tora TaxID=362788 RepID=A0A834SH02_9FABA|nr:uncharacterized protein G2W53_044944 [Senna tora]